jgi:lysyl-tRNA synthetase class 2
MSPGSKNRNYIVENQRLAARESCLRMRALIIQTIRAFFIGRGYLEIETPNLIPAPAPETHIDAVSAANGFLHPSPELCMKRLLSAGYSAIFQICKCYRGGERGRHHLPEFTLLEWYRAGADYMDIMKECEEMIRSVAADTGRGDRIQYMGREIDLKGPWQRMTVHEAFQRYSPMPLEDALDADRFDEIMVLHIEPVIDISRPLFLYDYPPSLAALSRIKRSDPLLAERFELYMGGLELANAFSELTDVDEQVKRFEKERERRRQLGKADYPFPDRFIKELGNMPDSAGIAFGIDRLVMLFADTDTIDDVVSFTPEDI